MSSIDQVINRSRQPGGFKERKRFTVARQRAIRKMREFALADPHYFVLELIQAAVANAASHVDLRCEKKSFGMSYIGGGFTQEELAQIFDFLFASKEDFEHGDIRQLALGVNALMIMEPDSIIIESGDGTMAGTTRIEIKGGENTVDVGTPDKALRGTFVRADGLNRRKIKGKSNLRPSDYGPPETMAIEQRCLAAPVPILVNDEPVFGYSSVRTPVVFGYRNVVTFDEGDLYGSIGIAEQTHKELFKLLTWGSWIQSLEHDLIGGARLGGVIAYDRLNKTADHSGIVRDERLAEMWARLKPYAHKVVSGETGRAVFRIAPLGEDYLEPRELRKMLVEHGSAVAVPLDVESGSRQADLAAEIGQVLDSPVLSVHEEEMQTLRNLAGSKVRLLKPDLSNPDELAFFKQPEAKAPARPWIIGPTELSAIEVDEFAELLYSEQLIPHSEEARTNLLSRLGGSGQITGTIYTPRGGHDGNQDHRRELWVRVRTVDRVVWEGAVTSAYPGHVLDVEVPSVSPSSLQRPVSSDGDASLAWLVAEVMARHAADDLQQTANRALESLVQFDIEPGSTGARVALAALARGAVKRLRSGANDGGKPHVRFSMIDTEANLDLLSVPVFRTLDGAPTTMRDLAMLMEETHGVAYGVVPEVEPDLRGLDQSKILELNLETERLLMSIIGEGAYVRVDRRDVLAEVGGVQVRDLALGLREYPDAPLLIEGGEQVSEERVEALVRQLIRMYAGAADNGASEDLRREALRHLQYFVCRRASEQPDAPTYGAEELGLFLDGLGRVVSFADVRAGFEAYERLVMVDGRSSDVTELAAVGGGKKRDSDEPPSSLMMNTWVLGLLQGYGELCGAFDFDLTNAEAADVELTPETAFVVSTEVEAEGLTGRVGLPEAPVDDPAIAVVSADRRKVYQLRQPAIEYGMVGMIRMESGDVEQKWNHVYSAAVRAGQDTLRDLIDRLPELEGDEDYERVLYTLFAFASRHLRMTKRPDDTIHHEISHALAQHIFDIPLFATRRGVPVSAQRLINEFCVEQTRGTRIEQGSRIELADEVPDVLVRWVERHLTSQNIARPPAESAQHQAITPEQAAAARGELRPSELAALVEHWLEELRPDLHAAQLAEQATGAAVVDAVESALADGVDPYEQLGDNLAEKVRSSQTRVLLVDPDDEATHEALPYGNRADIVDQLRDGETFVYALGQTPTLVIHARHWLTRQALEQAKSDPKALAWLLLAAYSHINALLEPVTNDHELDFQARVGEALQKGKLRAAV